MIKLLNILKEIVNPISELSSSDHFQLRISQRGNILDILNLNEIPLKDYKLSDVKEKLKDNISNELNIRVGNILSRDMSISDTYDVGIRVLKPVLVVDNKKYTLNLFAKSTKELKDKEGNVIGTREVDNIGFLYLITISNNKATTLLLLDKEDESNLYFQVKKHTERERKSNKEAKILPSAYEYKIDLDELMGVVKDKEVALIDPATLDYTLRTDYRKGANFTHKKYGTGKIINTSSGSGGEGDSRGKLDWIEVDFGKPVLKGGKLTPYRRIEDILTLVSPLLKK